MKLVAVTLVMFGLVAGIIACIFRIFPFNNLLEYFVDPYGRFPVAQVYGGTFLFYLIPSAIAMIIDNLIEKIKSRK